MRFFKKNKPFNSAVNERGETMLFFDTSSIADDAFVYDGWLPLTVQVEALNDAEDWLPAADCAAPTLMLSITHAKPWYKRLLRR